MSQLIQITHPLDDIFYKLSDELQGHIRNNILDGRFVEFEADWEVEDYIQRTMVWGYLVKPSKDEIEKAEQDLRVRIRKVKDKVYDMVNK